MSHFVKRERNYFGWLLKYYFCNKTADCPDKTKLRMQTFHALLFVNMI